MEKSFIVKWKGRNKRLKNRKGITLIALVVTIIILLILAGVSLNLIAGSEGMLEKTSKAVDISEVAKAEEEIELIIAEKMIEYYEGKKDEELSVYLKDKLNGTKTPSGATITCGEDGKIKYNDVIIGTIDENGKVTMENVKDVTLGKNDPDKIKDAYYLYYKGEEYINQGGEWVNNAKSPEASTGKLEKKEDYMVFSAGVCFNRNPVCTKTETMDISNYDVLYADIEILDDGAQGDNVGFEILDALGGRLVGISTYFPRMGIYDMEIGKRTLISMDLTNLGIDLKDVYFGISNHGFNVKIYSVYLM